MSKQLVFMIAATLVGTLGALYIEPFLGIATYYLFAVLRPQSLWKWILPPEVRWSYYVAVAGIIAIFLYHVGPRKPVLGPQPPRPKMPRFTRGHWWVVVFGAWIWASYTAAYNKLYSADVMQDVFHSLTQNIGRFEQQANGGGFRGWLWTIARNKIRDHFRRLKGKAQAAGGTNALQQLNELPDHPPDVASVDGAVELSRLNQRALELVRSDFEERTWQAFWRATVDGDAPADVAADLGVSVWTVYKARARVLARLRDELGGLIGH